MSEKRGPSLNASFVASGDLSSSQFRFVTFSGNDCYLPTSGVVMAGVLQNKPTDNNHADVLGSGYSKLYYGNSLGGGVEVMAGLSGFATLAASGQWVGGLTLSAGNSGDLGEALINIHQKSLA